LHQNHPSCQNERHSNTGQDSDDSNKVQKNAEQDKQEEEKHIVNIEEELKNTIFSARGGSKKVFSDLSSKNTIRAWEKIQKVSKLLKTPHRSLVIQEIIKAKRTQNCGGDRFIKRHSAAPTVQTGDKDTIPSSKNSLSLSVDQKVSKIYPYKVHQKIFRFFRKYFKTQFETFLKGKKVVFNRVVKKMSQDDFNSHLIDFMDEYFPNMIEELNEATVEKIMETLSIFILKDRHKKKEPVSEGLQFDEWNDLVELPNVSKTIHFFGRSENAFLYAFFFLKE
jgi:hypothetical protein